MDKELRVCYFGIYPPTIARNKVCVDGLRANGVKVSVCVDDTPGFRKFFKLFRLLRQLSEYDILLVGYLSNILVPLGRLVSKKPVVYNALNSIYESMILDREAHKRYSLSALYYWLVDFIAFKSSHMILVESEAQKKYLSQTFFVNPKKMRVIYTGADEEQFFPSLDVSKKREWSVGCRGGFLPATGTKHIIDAAMILRDKPIKFYLYGRGMLQKEIEASIRNKGLNNVVVVDRFLSFEELRHELLSCQVLLGQFGKHERLNRTIQNKTFEALALGMPYITADTQSNKEILTDRKDCLLVRDQNADELASMILTLYEDDDLLHKLGVNALQTFRERFKAESIGSDIKQALITLCD